MGHFSCLVVAGDVERALQPYHQFEATGHEDEYVKKIVRQPEYYHEEHKFYLEDNSLNFLDFLKEFTDYDAFLEGEGTGKYGWIEVDKSGKVVRVIEKTNPNRKWDWWTIGGRWRGRLRLKPHVINQLKKEFT